MRCPQCGLLQITPNPTTCDGCTYIFPALAAPIKKRTPWRLFWWSMGVLAVLTAVVLAARPRYDDAAFSACVKSIQQSADPGARMVFESMPSAATKLNDGRRYEFIVEYDITARGTTEHIRLPCAVEKSGTRWVRAPL